MDNNTQIDLSKVVGELYIESYRHSAVLEQKYQGLLQELRKKITDLEAENTMLKRVVEKASGAEQQIKTTAI